MIVSGKQLLCLASNACIIQDQVKLAFGGILFISCVFDDLLECNDSLQLLLLHIAMLSILFGLFAFLFSKELFVHFRLL